MNDLLTSIIRTVVPIVMGALSATGVQQWVPLDIAENALVALLAVVYYVSVRILEQAGFAHIGWMLGVPKPPVYVMDTGVIAEVPAEARGTDG